VYSAKCDNCSMIDVCLPKTLSKGRTGSVDVYLNMAIEEV